MVRRHLQIGIEAEVERDDAAACRAGEGAEERYGATAAGVGATSVRAFDDSSVETHLRAMGLSWRDSIEQKYQLPRVIGAWNR